MDDGWKPIEIEPEALPVNGNGTNGHHDLFGVGPTVELVPANGNMPVNGNGTNGNGDHDEDPESQWTLFSWAEFMVDEPVKPKGRKPEPASASLFEWALEMEQEREKDPVSAEC